MRIAINALSAVAGVGNRHSNLQRNNTTMRIEMLKTIEGIYEDGNIKLQEKPGLKKSKVIVTFLEERNGGTIVTSIPDAFINPVRVSRIKKFSREELHER